MAEEKKKAAAPSAAAATKSTKSTKSTKERTFTSASTGEVVEKTMGHAVGAKANVDLDASHAQRAAQAKGKRIAAAILWVVAILVEVVAILGAVGKIQDWSETPFGAFTYSWTFLIICLVVMAILTIIGQILWKSANHIDPPRKEGNAFKYWLQTEFGSIMAVIAFLPIIIILLTNKNVDAQSKKFGLIGAAVALVLCSLTGIDYNPVSQEEIDAIEMEAAAAEDGGLCYWTPYGKKYHFNPDCQYIKNSTDITQGTIDQAHEAGRMEPCKGCAVEGGQYVLHETGVVVPDDAPAADQNAA